MFEWLFRLLNDERGEVGGTDESEDIDGSGEELEADTEDAEQDSQPDEQEESFVDTKSLPDDIKQSAEFKGMQRAFSRKMNRFKEAEQKIAILEQIENDPNFRRQFLERAAQQTGYQLVAQNGNQQKQDPALAKLSEYEAAIPGLTDALKALVEQQVAPIKQRTEESMTAAQRQMHQQEWDRAATEMTEADPEWEDAEDEMGDIFEFMKSPNMFHPVWGNKLTMLYKLARGEDAAAAEAVDRIKASAKNRTHTGRNGGGQISISDIQKQIAESKSAQNKWDIAARFAADELKKTGGRV